MIIITRIMTMTMIKMIRVILTVRMRTMMVVMMMIGGCGRFHGDSE